MRKNAGIGTIYNILILLVCESSRIDNFLLSSAPFRRIINGFSIEDVIDRDHLFMTAGANEGIYMENSLHSTTPVAIIKTSFVSGCIVEPMDILFLEGFGNGFRIEAVSGVETKVTDHDEMWFLNMLAETENEIKGRQRFGLMTSVSAITDMSFVVEGNKFSVIRINAG